MTAVLPDELTRDNTKDIAKNDESFENVLGKIKARQWTLADFDWDKPGADTINPEQFDDLKQFMSDLVWIEHIGGRMMGTLGITAPNDTLREIYSYFHAEEQRHANAEIALMRRWGMLAEGEIPPQSGDIKALLQALRGFDNLGDRRLPFVYMATVIPFFEVGLDGAVLKFLSGEVEDPLFHEVFAKINSDESRHLAIGFAVMDMLGTRKFSRMLVEDVAPLLKPVTIVRAVGLANPHVIRFAGFLTRVGDAMRNMGIDTILIQRAFDRYAESGGRKSSNARRLPIFRVLRYPIVNSTYFTDFDHPLHKVGRAVNKFNDKVPYRKKIKTPTWTNDLTAQTAV
ncbi:hypothetical protein [Mycobacteroides abscessus]|uniref:hypothetical protein n=1 Tax=Mycobacteroides abscessus TaxID=36809 RepID=UPI00092941D3|nr:hypothetical protein [Mycobacteroides abscessus]SID94869.1 putative reductase [Mycobacteroides abscessus subsp. abscessus]